MEFEIKWTKHGIPEYHLATLSVCQYAPQQRSLVPACLVLETTLLCDCSPNGWKYFSPILKSMASPLRNRIYSLL